MADAFVQEIGYFSQYSGNNNVQATKIMLMRVQRIETCVCKGVRPYPRAPETYIGTLIRSEDLQWNASRTLYLIYSRANDRENLHPVRVPIEQVV